MSPSILPTALREGVEAALSSRVGRSVEILGAEPVTGGCIHQTVRISTNLREDFFLKWAQDPLSDVFAAEADGLSALKGSTGDSIDLTLPEVVGHSDTRARPAWLLLEYVPHGSPGGDYAERLGRALAALHQPGQGRYGWHRSNYIGSLPQANAPMDDWPAFWWSQRLEPQWVMASDNGWLAGLDREWAALESKLPDLLKAAEEDGCSILHGDLWSGNVYPGPDGGPVLVDPAVYRGHREVDLAMTELFGGFPRAFYAAYEDHSPLEDGYEDLRRCVYQLYPLLVHVNLFGGSYVNGVAGALRRAVASR
ncbi:MAG: fructosamine kinase family protein [Gemmatimonadetes bacterium]|nr:fructosamine kinase family protein [Gemmatimonadota bacterium]MCH8810635.1 fructosamine kinase family protein [Gemmatimonadota bacterium]